MPYTTDDVKKEMILIRQTPWMLYVAVVLLISVVLYLGWSLWGKHTQIPGQGFVPATPAVNSPKVPGPVLKVPVKKVSKSAVTKKFPTAVIKGDTNGDGHDEEEWVDTSNVPNAPHGATVLTKIDVNTGEVSSDVKIKPAPWFELRRTNVVEVNGIIGIRGQGIRGEYKREIVAVKGVTLQVGIGGQTPIGVSEIKGDVYGTLGLKYSWE